MSYLESVGFYSAIVVNLLMYSSAIYCLKEYLTDGFGNFNPGEKWNSEENMIGFGLITFISIVLTLVLIGWGYGW